MSTRLTIQNGAIVSGSLDVSGSVRFASVSQGSQVNILTYDTASGQLFFTASSAIGGGGSTPTLQQVTTAGSGSTNNIDIIATSNNKRLVSLTSPGGSGVIIVASNNVTDELRIGANTISYRTSDPSIFTNLSKPSLTNKMNFIDLPDESGTLVLKVNGVSADLSGSITIPTGSVIATGSFATTGSNTFIGEQTISGSIQISGSIIPATDGISTTSSFSLGSATNAWKDIFVSNGTINFLDGAGNVQAALSSTDQGLQIQNYPADTGSVPVFSVSGSGTFSSGLTVTGSLSVSGSLLVPLTGSSLALTGSMYVDPANNKLWIYTGNGGVGGWVTASLG